jgi:hypothetical protein
VTMISPAAVLPHRDAIRVHDLYLYRDPMPRSHRIATNLETSQMTANFHLAHFYANEQRLDLLRDAEHERKLNEASRGNRRSLSALHSLRNTLGSALVALGLRLQHPAPASKPASSFGSLTPTV